MKKKLILILFCIGLYSCKEEDNLPNSKDIEIVTGMHLINNFGGSIGSIGNPNVLNSNVHLAFYPNPAIDILSVISITKIKNIWILKGKPDRNFKNIDFTVELSANLYTKSEIKNTAIFEVQNIDGNNKISINLDRFEKGYYRVFVELEDGTINWNNIYFKAFPSEMSAINYWN